MWGRRGGRGRGRGRVLVTRGGHRLNWLEDQRAIVLVVVLQVGALLFASCDGL